MSTRPRDETGTRPAALRPAQFGGLQYVVRGGAVEGLPLLCFLHGLGEAAPLELVAAMSLHGPLRDGNPIDCLDRFVIVAPQLPVAGDVWHTHADAVQGLVRFEAERHACDTTRLYLTGFSYGGNGVFDLALLQPRMWAALWPVDPTRVPPVAIPAPLWLSLGEIARRELDAYVERLALQPADERDRTHLWKDEGLGHVESAASAYRDSRIYRWLLEKRRPPA